MALVALRQLTNHPNAATFDFAGSPTTTWFAEDYLRIRDAIQLGVTGIRTRTLQVGDDTLPTVLGASRIGNLLEVGTNITDQTDLGLTVNGTSTLGGLLSCGSGLSVTGNVAVTGTVDGVDVAGHTHTGADGTANIPLDSVVGVTGGTLWSAHDHDGDGSGAIGTNALDAGAVTFAKIASAAVGIPGSLTSSTVARGDTVQAIRTAIASFMSGGDNVAPWMGQFVPATAMNIVGGDSEASLAEYSASPGGTILAREFASGANDVARFNGVIPGAAASAVLYLFYFVDSADLLTAGSPTVVNVTVTQTEFAGDATAGVETIQSLPLSIPSGPDEMAIEEVLSMTPVTPSPAQNPEAVSVKIERTDSETGSLYLFGASLNYDPDW